MNFRHAMLAKHFLRAVMPALLVLLAVASLATYTNAQSTGGRIRGTVTDSTGGAISAAKLTITNQANGLQRDTETGSNGEYIILEVPVGTYDIAVSQTGFKKYLRKDIAVNLNEIVGVDIVLQVGGATEVVEVTGAPPLVDTTSTQLGAVVGERAVSELPLAQRDTYQLLQLQPGVQSQLGVDNLYGSDRAGVVSVNGGRGRDNNFTVNGGDGNDQFANLPAIQPSPDSIAEFRVLTNTFDAEYGRNSGAVVNVVTKSGSNDFHGNLYEFFRNKNLNAKGFFDFEKLDYLQNQFGATLGGPIKKDKTFFFVTYEGDRLRKGTSSDTVAVPTADERAGNFGATPFQGGVTTDFFAQTLNSRCGLNIPMPSTQPDGIVPYSAIFPDSVIPTQCMDQTALDLLNRYVPQANRADGTFQAGPLGHERSNQFTVKMDHELSKNQRLSGYYYFTQHYLAKPFARFQAGGATLPGFGDLTDERIQQLNISHTWTIGATSVNEVRFTFFREGQGTFLHPQHTALVQDSCTTVSAAQCFADPANPDLGIHPNLGANREGVPYINISGGFSIGNNFEGELPQKGNTYQISDSFGKVIGNHSLKFGGDFRSQQFDQRLYFNINGSYYLYGGGPNDTASDNLFADYLLGLNDNYIEGSAQDELIRSKSVYLFAQDSWKLKSNLTLNYGLRWELNTPLADIGKKVQTYRPGQDTTIYPCAIGPNDPLFATFGSDCAAAGVIPTGLVVAGDRGVPTGLTSTYYKSFAPRIGLAWSPSAKDGILGRLFGGPGRTSIRAGFGIFYNPIEQLVMEQFSAEPPFGGSSSIYDTMFNLPFQYQDGTTAPNPFNGILNPPRGQAVDWAMFRPILLYGQAAPHIRSQYAEQYNLTIQREIAKDLVFQIAYVGRQGHRLLATQEINPGNPQTCLDLNSILGVGTCGQYGADSSYFIDPGTVLATDLHLPYGPTKVIPAGTTIGSDGITLVGLRPFSSPNCDPTTAAGCPADGLPVFSSIFQQGTISSSSYHALQMSLEQRFSHGLQFTAAYTYGKSLDYASTFESLVNPFNPRIGRSPSLFDARHRFVFSYYWDLPIPKHEGFAGKVLNGWSVSGTTTAQTGFPIRITEQDDNELYSSFDFETSGQPNLIAPFKKLNPRGALNQGFDPSSFSTGCIDPADPNNLVDNPLCSNEPGGVVLGTIGNAPRTICCGPGAFQTDIGIFKNTNIGERYRVQFRGELFNVFNYAQFYQPDGNITDGSDFGRVKRAREPRLVQFALKFYF
ncbi:MAG: Plug and carboxypeptidase regulatory-like domain-containing protein [Acidobacteriota bacterium]|nr:Plug and carboxypeptidase regulatory-like domain-containing protein [Acidobacteriota bacterium]